MTINGRTWVLAPDVPETPCDIQPTVNLAEVTDEDVAYAMTQDNIFEFVAYQCVNDTSHISVDWSKHSTLVDLSLIPTEPVAYTMSCPAMSHLPSAPFILDSGANCHVSPKRSDFKSLCPIPTINMKGFGGSTAKAVGMGSIEICVAPGTKISLSNILFIPSSTVCLMSVSALNHSSNYTSHFDSHACWVTNCSGVTILCGMISGSRNLYMINLPSAHVAHSPSTPMALYTECKPDIETWHHCLSQATHPLECVFVDLCGPMPCSSHSRCLYSMNLIDDFSSYIWSLPLRNKAEAVLVLQNWHKHVMTQFDRPLKILVTDNGELVSNAMSSWCLSNGINHLVTAPYMSAQSSRAERVHCTILRKARAMRLACNASLSLWDEFCITTAYLTNLTAMPMLSGKTPYELWCHCLSMWINCSTMRTTARATSSGIVSHMMPVSYTTHASARALVAFPL